MFDILKYIFDTDFDAHGHCFFWDPEILWTHAISDSIIALAYLAIPLTLVYIFQKRRDVKFVWMMILFALFILGCGATHVFDVITIWIPLYRIDGWVRVITAMASIGTAIVLIKVTPSILEIPTTTEWRELNRELYDQVSQLKQKDALIEQIRVFEFLSEAMPQIIWAADPTGKIEYYNSKWYEYTGLHEKLGDQTKWQTIIHPDDYENVLKDWLECLANGKSYEHQFRIKNAAGLYRWHLVRSVAMHDHAGEIIKWIGTATDMHDQKIQSEELKQKNSQLLRINRELDNFVYTASHDLKAPISNLEGLMFAYKDQAKERLLNEDLQILDMMQVSIEKFKATIKDLTEISRLNQVNDVVEEISIKEILNEILLSLNTQIKENEAKIEIDIQSDLIRFSKKNLRSILSNLLTNSIKFKKRNLNPQIQIKTWKENDTCVISVSDNGLGMDLSKSDKIFSMFRRLHDHVEGSGLGLYLIKRIVEDNNGRIEVESEIGQGSTFRIYLPE